MLSRARAFTRPNFQGIVLNSGHLRELSLIRPDYLCRKFMNLALFRPDFVSFLAACAGKLLNYPDLSLFLAVFLALQISI